MSENLVRQAKEQARQHAHEYAAGAERPLKGYVGALGVFGGAVAGAVTVARALGRPAPRLSGRDTVLLAAATHKLSRLVAKDPITSPLRAPFTRYQGTSAPSELAEEVRGHGTRHTVGELLTCPFCLAPWAAAALLATWSLSPATARTCCTALTAVAGADFLQYAYAAAQQAE